MAGDQGAAEGGGPVKDVETRIKEALDGFGIPVEKGLLYARARDLPPRYFAFSVSRYGDDFGDDGPGCERCLVSVHYFAPLAENLTERVRRVKKALLAAGFTWPSSVDASDQDGQHIVFDCEAPEEVGDDG